MNLIQISIEKPTAVVAAIFMTIVLGFIALDRIPIQLAPDVNKPVITVSTWWYGASPYEIEREIVNRQEEVLRGIEGAKRLTAKAEIDDPTGEEMETTTLDVADWTPKEKEEKKLPTRKKLNPCSRKDNKF